MPIFYRSGERVLFVHIPKVAGTSVLVWLCDNGWRVTNHTPHRGASLDILQHRYGITSIPTEGPQPSGVSPQHADRRVFQRWGEFSYAFTLVRDPLERLRSHLDWMYARACATGESLPPPERFANAYLRLTLEAYAHDATARDNHVRPQVDFLTPEMEVLRLEDPWAERLQERLGLQPPIPYQQRGPATAAATAPLDRDVAEAVIAHCQADFAALGYRQPSVEELIAPGATRGIQSHDTSKAD